jgi:hypothetical protein
MAILTFIIAMGGKWQSLGGQLFASGILLMSGHQDIRMRNRIGGAFWFFMALAFGISALVTAIWAKAWCGVAVCAVAPCSETWLILRWWRNPCSTAKNGTGNE